MHPYTMRQKPMQPNRCYTRRRSSTSCWIPVCELWYCLLPGKYAVVTDNKSLLCEMSMKCHIKYQFCHLYSLLCRSKTLSCSFFLLKNTKEVLESYLFAFRLKAVVLSDRSTAGRGLLGSCRAGSGSPGEPGAHMWGRSGQCPGASPAREEDSC